MAVFTHSSPIPGAASYVDGDLVLELRRPVAINDQEWQKPYEHTAILNTSNIQAAQDLRIQDWIARYRTRDCAAHFHAVYPVWTSQTGQKNTMATQPRRFKSSMTIRVGQVDVLCGASAIWLGSCLESLSDSCGVGRMVHRYTPSWSEVLKKAWIQVGSLRAVGVQLPLNPLACLVLLHSCGRLHARVDTEPLLIHAQGKIEKLENTFHLLRLNALWPRFD